MKIDGALLQQMTKLSVLSFDGIDSTNLYCKRRIKSGDPFLGIVTASFQTNGQGRTGKAFYSPKNSGVYFTFALKKDRFLREELTPIVALAACAAIESVFGLNCGVKWVNDIYLQGRKVGGILCQIVDNFVLIGVGINLVEPSEIPDELRPRMGWLVEHLDNGQREKLISKLYENLLLYNEKDKDEIYKEYSAKCIHVGKSVIIEHDNEALTGICVGIDEDFSLLVNINGKIRSFESGYMVLRI